MRAPMKLTAIVTAALLVAAACGGGGETSPPAPTGSAPVVSYDPAEMNGLRCGKLLEDGRTQTGLLAKIKEGAGVNEVLYLDNDTFREIRRYWNGGGGGFVSCAGGHYIPYSSILSIHKKSEEK